MSLIFPKKEILYAPMLGTLGGGSARGFGRGGGGVPSFESLSLITTFTNTSTGRLGSIQSYTIPSDGYYSFVTRGAKGADNTQGGESGGSGMQITPVPAEFTAGTQLSILVGQAGTYGTTNSQNTSGGGGGSFVWKSADNTLYVAAGGGGGASSVDYSFKNATHLEDANNGHRTATQIAANVTASLGGTGGNGGNQGDGDNRGGGGAGWFSNGLSQDGTNTGVEPNGDRQAKRPLDSNAGRGGKGGSDSQVSGAFGGYGGGGGGGYHGTPAYGGGGGGYSGGGGGSWEGSSSGPGGGGGSYSFVEMHDYQLHSNTHGAVLIYGQ